MAMASVLMLIMAYILIIILITVTISIIVAIFNWKIFKKLGIYPWYSLIPFYNTYKVGELLINNGTRLMIEQIIVYGISSVLGGLLNAAPRVALATDNDVLGVIILAIDLILIIAVSVYWSVRYNSLLCKALGYGTGMIVLSIFFRPVIYGILALGSHKFVGGYTYNNLYQNQNLYGQQYNGYNGYNDYNGYNNQQYNNYNGYNGYNGQNPNQNQGYNPTYTNNTQQYGNQQPPYSNSTQPYNNQQPQYNNNTQPYNNQQ
jgi:hypothetical protein